MERIYFIGGVGKPGEFGGEASKNKEIVRILSERGYDVTVIDTLNSSKNYLRLLSLAWAIFSAVLFHPRATIIFSTSFGNIYPFIKLFRALGLKRNIIYWAIGGVFSQWILDGKFDRKYLTVIRRFIVEGEKMKRELAQAGFKDVIVVPNFKTIPRIQCPDKYDDGKIHFYFISRVIPQKGVPAILECARILNEKPGYRDRFEIDIFGPIEPSYAEDFLSEIKSLGNVSYKGQLNLIDPENYKAIARYHYMLFPTRWIGEGFPGVIIDAMIAGTPVLASDWNFNSEFIKNGLNGYIYPVNDNNALLSLMVKNIQFSENFSKLSDYCRKLAVMYDTSNQLSPNSLKDILSFERD